MTKFDILVIVFTFIIFFVMADIMFEDGKYVKYDCRLVDISPDIPDQVKRLCRGIK